MAELKIREVTVVPHIDQLTLDDMVLLEDFEEAEKNTKNTPPGALRGLREMLDRISEYEGIEHAGQIRLVELNEILGKIFEAVKDEAQAGNSEGASSSTSGQTGK